MDHRIHQITQHQLLHVNKATKQNKQLNNSFKNILKQQQDLKISKHAAERLNNRNITISQTDWQVINEKIDEAKEKGITNSLVVLDDAALLVSAENKTVVTAMNLEESHNRIFTNINGTIVLR